MAILTIDDMHTMPEDEVEYLDLDGDGVPDAVRIREVTVLHLADDDIALVREEIDAGIDDDGVPHAVELRETIVDAAH